MEQGTQEMGINSYSLSAARAILKGLLSLKQAADSGGPEPSKGDLRRYLGSGEESSCAGSLMLLGQGHQHVCHHSRAGAPILYVFHSLVPWVLTLPCRAFPMKKVGIVSPWSLGMPCTYPKVHLEIS